MERENGYYWIRYGDYWFVAEYVIEFDIWRDTNYCEYSNSQIDEVGEKIERKEL